MDILSQLDVLPESVTSWESLCTSLSQVVTISSPRSNQKQGPIFVAHKIITQPSTYVKFAIIFEITANPGTNSKFVDDFVMNKNCNQIFKVYVDH